jgi:histidinol-phosphatase (PHP family)
MSRYDLLKYGTAQELHCHTTHCDGKNTPEEMVLAAIEKGLDRIGFSGHSPSPRGSSYAMKPEGVAAYLADVRALKDKYADRIEVLCGLEQDLYSPTRPESLGVDYFIGSVHYIRVPDGYVCVDNTAEEQREGCLKYFGGDPYAMCEAYFAQYEALAALKPDIVGHIDLISKFCERDDLFDPNHPRFLAAAKGAIDALLPTGAIFEINTGALSRGWRRTPYPAPALLDYIKQKGGRVLLTGDSHAAGTLCYAFDDWKHLMN